MIKRAIVALKVVRLCGNDSLVKVNSMDNKSYRNIIQRRFPKLFNEIGTFKTEIHIKLLEHVQPYVQSVHRVVPIPLLNSLKKELERL